MLKKIYRDRIALWVKALRSGKYKQCRGTLMIETPAGKRYCCLGVVEEVYYRAHGEKAPWKDRGAGFFTVNGHGSNLEPKVAKWFGFVDDPDPVIYEIDHYTGPIYRRASACNDEYKWNFLRIARAIENEFLAPPKRAS